MESSSSSPAGGIGTESNPRGAGWLRARRALAISGGAGILGGAAKEGSAGRRRTGRRRHPQIGRAHV